MADGIEEGTESGATLGPDEGRIHRLESLVRSLQMENKRLLTCVDGNKSIAPSPAAVGRRSDSGPHQELVDLAREEEGKNGEQDVWLYVSPARPPTPEQRLVPPQQWLRERAGVDGGGNVPSLNEVRVALFSQESSARDMLESRGAGAVGVKRTSSAKSLTAQKFLDDVRHRRRNSLPDAHAPEVAVPSREESSAPRYELASGGGVRITPKWSNEERPRNVPIKPVLPLGNSPVVGVDSRRSPNVANVVVDNDSFSEGISLRGSRMTLEPDPAPPQTTAAEVDPEYSTVLHSTDHIHRSPLPRRKVPGSPKPRHKAVDPEQVHHKAVDPELYQLQPVDPEEAHGRVPDPEQYQHRAIDLDHAQRRSPLTQRKAIGSRRLQLSAVDPDHVPDRVVDQDQTQRRSVGSDKTQHGNVDPDQVQLRAADPAQLRAVDPAQLRAVNPDHVQRRSPFTQRKAIGSPELQISAVDPDHVQHRAVDPDKVQRRSVDPGQVEHKAVDPEQVQHRSPLSQRKVIGSPRLQHKTLDVNHRAVDPDRYPHVAVDPNQLHHKAMEPDQVQRRKVIGSPKLQRRAVESNHVKHVGVDPDHIQHRAVDPSQSPRRAVDPSQSPRRAVDPSQSLHRAVDPSQSPRRAVDPSQSPRRAVDPSQSPRRAVDPSQSPRRAVDPSQSPRRAVDPDHDQRKVVDPSQTQPKAVDLAKTPKHSSTRTLRDPAHLQRLGRVGVSTSIPAAVGQAPEHHTSSLSVSSGGVSRTRALGGLQAKLPTRGSGGAYSSPSVNGPSTKAPQRRSAGPPSVAQDTGWMEGCF